MSRRRAGRPSTSFRGRAATGTRGNFFTSYTSLKWFDRNNETRRGGQPSLLVNDHDVSGSFGGPIIKDRLWFFSVARHQGKESSQTGGPFYANLNAGLWGANYDPDIAGGPLTYKNVWRNVNARLTYQATQKNKFDVFWDEQDTCQDPCDGVVSVYTHLSRGGRCRRARITCRS